MDEAPDAPHRQGVTVTAGAGRPRGRARPRPQPRVPGSFTPEQVEGIRARAAAMGYRSASALAVALDVKHPTVVRWYSGQRAPSAEHRQRLAEVLELPPTTDFLAQTPPGGGAPPPPPGGPTANVYGTTKEVWGGLGYPLRPVYRTGTRLDLSRVGAERYPLPHTMRPMSPDYAHALGPESFVLLQGGDHMAGRRPRAPRDGDYWWIAPAARRAPTPGDLVAARVDDPPPDGEEGGVVLRSYDVDPETGEPALWAEPAEGVRLPVRGRWTVLGVALFAETVDPARLDA
jgi:hypothetical protein